MNGSRRPVGRIVFIPNQVKPGGFTLVELLVVIGIIAILVGVLLPALNKARQQSVRVSCAAQLRNLGQACVNYAANNKGWLPQHGGNLAGGWLWDVPIESRDQLVRYGADRKTLYCPVYSEQDKDGLWSYTGTVSVLGYSLMFERGAQPLRNGISGFPDNNFLPSPQNQYYQAVWGWDPKRKFVNKVSKQGRPNPEVELAFDTIIQDANSGRFVTTGGFMENGQGFPHATSHLGRNGLPLGINTLYLDGHVEWHEYRSGTGVSNTQYQKTKLKPRYQPPNNGPKFWW